MKKSGFGKKVFISFFVIHIFIVSSAFAADKNRAFSIGEKLKYNIYASGFYVGYQTIELKDGYAIDGVETYLLEGLSKTAAYVNIFYKIDNKWVIYIDKNTYIPIRIEKDFVEGKKEGYYIYHIKQKEKLVILHNVEKGVQKTIQTENRVFDLFSLIYFFRNNSAVIEDIYTFDFLEPKSVRTVHFKNEGETKISIPRISSDNSIPVQKITQIGGLGICIYVGTDDLKLPLKMIVPAKLKGKRKVDVEFILDKYSPGKDHKRVPVAYDRL